MVMNELILLNCINVTNIVHYIFSGTFLNMNDINQTFSINFETDNLTCFYIIMAVIYIYNINKSN